jgi:cholesterol oxidase
MLEHLGRMVKHHALCRADGQETYLADLGPLHIPITFLHGAKNGVFLPESSKRTYDVLVQEFGAAGYRRIEFPFHGHQDIMIGSETNQHDSFAAILGHLDRVGA